MGIQLTQLVHGEEIELERLTGKTLAIDAYNWIYQFLTSIRQYDGEPLKDSHGNITSHLSGLFYRNLKLLESHVKPVYVFDGKPSPWKQATIEGRRDVRKEAAEEWKAALERKDYTAAKKYAQRSATITEDIIEGSKMLLDAMGIPIVQAPSEGEALCSLMCKKGDVYAVATQDYDALLFEAPRIVRNLSISGKKKRGNSIVVINPEMIRLENMLTELGISQDQLILLGMLIGTDFNPGGIKGYGPKKSLDLVREAQTLEAIKGRISWEFSLTMEDLFDFFKNPRSVDYNFQFRDVNIERVKQIMVDQHDFSEERTTAGLQRLVEAKKKQQSSLSRWIK